MMSRKSYEIALYCMLALAVLIVLVEAALPVLIILAALLLFLLLNQK